MEKIAGCRIFWFRQDLRLADNPEWAACCASGDRVAPVYIWAPEDEAGWAPGAASRWWLHQALADLAARLEQQGTRLTLLRGRAVEVLPRLAATLRAPVIHANRRYEPAARQVERDVAAALAADGVELRFGSASLLSEPWEVKTQSGRPYQVFTPFWRSLQQQFREVPEAASPERTFGTASAPVGERLEDLRLEPRPDWAAGLRAAWSPTEHGAQQALADFLDEAAGHYSEGRDLPASRGTSRLSPYLHFGQLGPRQVLRAVTRRLGPEAASPYLRQLAWREFAYHLLHHFPHTAEQPLRPEFERFPWRSDAAEFDRWSRGRTGYPWIDAGMRELWATGWMHNRVRMAAASYLVKNLMIPWQDGAAWFWDTLVDADLANNTLGWQWTAGCGADAAPFFRIFNPVSQSRKFDPQGDYVRLWVPELADLQPPALHAPWTASPMELRSAGIRLGEDYPHPQVDLAATRSAALESFHSLPR